MHIVEVETGAKIRYTYTDVKAGTTEPVEVTLTGRKGREVGMTRLGNRGFMIETIDGREVPISRLAWVEVLPDDDAPGDTCADPTCRSPRSCAGHPAPRVFVFLVQRAGQSGDQLVVAAGDETGALLHAGHATGWRPGWNTTAKVTLLGPAAHHVTGGVLSR